MDVDFILCPLRRSKDISRILTMITVMVIGQYENVASSNYTLSDCMADIENFTQVAFTDPLSNTSVNFTTCQMTCLQENQCIAFYCEVGVCRHYSRLARMIDYQTGNVYFKCLACEIGWYYYQGLCYNVSPNCSNIGAVSARFYGLDLVVLHVVSIMKKPFYVREIINRDGVWQFASYNHTFMYVSGSGEQCVYANETMPLLNANCSLGLDEICEKDGKPKYQVTTSVTTTETISTFSTMNADRSTSEQTQTNLASTTSASNTTPMETINATTLNFPSGRTSTQKPEITTRNLLNQSKSEILTEIQKINSQTTHSTVRQFLKDLNPYVTNLTSHETQVVINATYNLVNFAIEANYSEKEYPLLLDDVANLTSNVPPTNHNLKLALTDSMLKITNQILILGEEEQDFYFSSNNFVLAGIKTDPKNLDGLNLKTEYGEVNIPDSMKETEETLYFKMISYKNPISDPDVEENGTQSSAVYISLEDEKNNAIPNPDPDKTYSLILKSESLQKQAWRDITEENDRKFAYQIPIKKSGLLLVELSFPEITIWGKLDEPPTKYNYHFHYSTLTQDKDIAKISTINIEKYGNILRLLIKCKDPRTSLYLLVNSEDYHTERLQKRLKRTHPRIRSVAVQPWLNRKSFTEQRKDEYEPFDIQDTFVDENYNVILKTNLFGTFTSVISFITPQTLDFTKIFVDFDKKVLNNPYVLIVLLSIFLVYCILALMMRRLDKKDQIKWRYLPLADNSPSDSWIYLMRVYTGIRSSRRMTVVPYFILKGKKGSTYIRILDDKVRHNFCHGTVSDFLLRTDTDLGDLLSLRIWHDNAGSCPKWFLSQIDIKDAKDDKCKMGAFLPMSLKVLIAGFSVSTAVCYSSMQVLSFNYLHYGTPQTYIQHYHAFVYSFPCHDWLSFDKGDGSIIRLLESHSNESDNFFTNIKTRIHIGLFEDHLYVSIVKRPRSSHFTRLQRLSTLVGVLYLSLISNAMYYKPNDKTPSRAFTLGPFTLSSKEIAVGIISSLIMVIPTSIIINLFRWRKVKGEKPDVCEESLSLFDRMKRFRLPWWSVYLAYFLIFLCIGISAYFTFIYSILWGKELALQWLLSVIVNVTGSVILIQPVKIGIVAMLSSYFFQSPLLEDDVCAEILESTKSSEMIHPVIKICPPPNMQSEEWKDKKRTMRLDHKLSNVFQTLFFRFFYLTILVAFIANERINTRFNQNDAIEQRLNLNRLKENQGIEGMWNWIETCAVPVIFPLRNHNGQLMLLDEQRYLADQVNKRLGAVRFRQSRSEKGWIKIQNTTKNEFIRAAFHYTSSIDSRENFKQQGTLGYYQNGGYIVDINERYLKAKQILSDLRLLNWIDERTRCLFICVGTYNANTGLYMQTIVQLERLSVGGIQSRVKAFSFKLYPFIGLWDYFMLLVLVLLACLTVGSVIKLLIRLRKMKRPTLFAWGVVFTLLNIIFSLMILFGYIGRIDRLLVLRDDLIAHPDKYASADLLIMQEQVYLAGLCGCILVAMLRLLEPMSFNYQLFLMKGSICVSMPSLLSFAVFLAIILSAFGFSLHVTLCGHSSHFKDMRTVYLTLFRIFLLMGKFHETFQLDRTFTHLVFFAYGFTVSIILLNICVSIINDSFTYIRDMQLDLESKYKFDQRLNDHFWDRIRKLFGRRKHGIPQSVCQFAQKADDNYTDIKKVLLKMDWIICKTISDYEKEETPAILREPFVLSQSGNEDDQLRFGRSKRARRRSLRNEEKYTK